MEVSRYGDKWSGHRSIYLVVFFTNVLVILLGYELSHDRVATDNAGEAVGMEGDSIDSQGS